MRSEKGITIIELLVVLIVGAVMLIGVNAISSIGNRSHRKLMEEGTIYNDISYVFKLLQSRVHRSKIQSDGAELVTGNEKFGVYVHSGGRDLLYYPNRLNTSINQVLFSVPDPGTLNFAYDINETAGDVDITLTGERNEVSFNMTTKIRSRRY